MIKIETVYDIVDEIADRLGIYGEKRSFFAADLEVRIKDAVANEEKYRVISDNSVRSD
jgi:hypothetical protein